MDRIFSPNDTSCGALLALKSTNTSNTTIWRLDTEDIHAGWANCAGMVKFSLPLIQKYGRTNLHGQYGMRTWKDYFRILGRSLSTMGYLLETHKRLLMQLLTRSMRIPTSKVGSSRNGIHTRGMKKGKMKTQTTITMTKRMVSMNVASSGTRTIVAGMMRLRGARWEGLYIYTYEGRGDR